LLFLAFMMPTIFITTIIEVTKLDPNEEIMENDKYMLIFYILEIAS